MEKFNSSKDAVKGAITKIESFVKDNTKESNYSSTELIINK